MTYVVAEPCIGTKDRACVEVCPVECFYEGADQLYIHPEECIDCAACEPVCPVTAIFPEENVPEQWKSYIEKQATFIKEHPEAPHALTKPMLGDQENFAQTFTVEGKTITLPPPPSGFGGPTSPAPKAEAKPAPKAEAPKAEAPPAPPKKEEVRKPEVAAPKAAAPARPVAAAPGDAISQIAEAAAAAAEAAARAAEAAAAAIRMLQGKADGRAGFGAPSAPVAEPHAPTTPKAEAPAAPKVEPKKEPAPSAPAQRQAAEVESAGPDPTFDRGKEVLYSLIDFESGSREVNVEELSHAEDTAARLFEEIAKAVGKRNYDLKDLEKKGIVLRQKLELANAILDRVARVRLLAEIKMQRARTREQIPGAVVAFSIAGACSILGFVYALKYSVATIGTLSLQDLLTALFTPEGFMPFIGFNLLAGIFALFGLGALYTLARSWVEACHLEALLPKEFGAASLRPKRWSWVYRLKIESERIMQAQKMLQVLAAKKR